MGMRHATHLSSFVPPSLVDITSVIGSIATAGALIVALAAVVRESLRRRQAVERANAAEVRSQAREVWCVSRLTGDTEWPETPIAEFIIVNNSNAPIQGIYLELTEGWNFAGEYTWEPRTLLLPGERETQRKPVAPPQSGSTDLTGLGPPFSVRFYDNRRQTFLRHAEGNLDLIDDPIG